MNRPSDPFEPPDEDAESPETIPLESLSAAYAELIHGAPSSERSASEGIPPADGRSDEDDRASDPTADVTPLSIVEAMLFVGSSSSEPLSSERMAQLIRGVSVSEIDELVATLNRVYDAQQRAFRIESVGAGYALTLRPQYAGLRDKFFGRVREARLSQAAIDILAIVAYQQPLTRDEIDQLRGRSSGAVLNQLVRRQLLRIERPEDRPRQPKYFTTDRFLDLFGLESLSELPETHELERDF
jgi:segregation and condensation protein B